MKQRISSRLEHFDSSVFRNLFIHQQTLTDPTDLSIGSPEDMPHERIKKAGIEAIQNDKTGYTPSNGLPELRHAITDKLFRQNDIMLPANQISVVPGLTTGLLLVYMAILDKGDEIIIMDPGYPPYEQLAMALGAEVQSVLTLPSFQLNLPAIEASITDKTKAIVINSPNNPTGAVYPEKDLRKLVDLAAANDILIISDEIYEYFTYEGKHFSIGSIYPNTISMFGFSKQYSMTGWRLGYIAGPYDVIEAVNELQQYSVFSSSAIAQYAAVEALKIESDFIVKYAKKRELVLEVLKSLEIEVSGVQGSYYAFFKAPHNMTDVEFCEHLLDFGLILVPGRAFSSRHGYVRLSYGTTMTELKKGLDKLQKAVRVIK